MIIQCEQCNTKFKLDDSKVTDKGVKVRCAKCKHVFTVRKTESTEEPVTPFGDMLESSMLGEPAPDRAEEESPLENTNADFDASSFDFSVPEETNVASVPATDNGNDFNLSSLDGGEAFSTDAPGDDVDFDAFDFGDAAGSEDETVVAASVADFGDKTVIQQKTAPAADDFGGLDFSGDSMFGEVVPQTPEEPANDISFDLQMDDFAASMGVEDTVEKQNKATVAAEPVETPFSLGEIDFGDDLTSVAVQQVNPEELKPGQDILFAPLAENQNPFSLEVGNDTLRSDVSQPAAVVTDELPPLSISSRRKQGPMTVVLAALGAVLAIVVAYFGYTSLKDTTAAAPQDAGRISIRSVDASFVKNKIIGDLLVIKGEAVNEYSRPRAAIQVKGLLYGVKGEVVASKNAFCGNPLTPEQLSTLPLNALESAMANQFGDSLSNMEVLPGKAVPFVVVIAKPSAEAKDYGVESAGSTVAAAK